MNDNYNYPMGADNSSAPWNQGDMGKKDFKVTIEVLATKHTQLATSQHDEYFEGLDEDGYPIIDYNTYNVDWKSEYEEQEYPIPYLMGLLEQYLTEDLKNAKLDKDQNKFKRLIKSCQGWEIQNVEIEIDD